METKSTTFVNVTRMANSMLFDQAKASAEFLKKLSESAKVNGGLWELEEIEAETKIGIERFLVKSHRTSLFLHEIGVVKTPTSSQHMEALHLKKEALDVFDYPGIFVVLDGPVDDPEFLEFLKAMVEQTKLAATRVKKLEALSIMEKLDMQEVK